MKVKKVLAGLRQQYDLEEVHIICMDEARVLFSGALDSWKATSVDMILYKREVENMEVKDRIMFNHRKAFLFV